ncbi:MAG: histidine phosphatase family protein [Clostridia bacterium]|nr:histidine phosphatase family protein [Clostridia bacterium]
MILYYIRHGDPIYDPDSLTELGHKQAEALANRFALYGLDEIYCSVCMLQDRYCASESRGRCAATKTGHFSYHTFL